MLRLISVVLVAVAFLALGRGCTSEADRGESAKKKSTKTVKPNGADGTTAAATTPPAAKPTRAAAPDEPPAPEKVITNSVGMKLVLIPAGEFMMGSGESAQQVAAAFNEVAASKEDVDLTAGLFEIEHPQHRVRITKPFYLGAHEVTVGQFRQFVTDTNHKTDAEKDGEGGFGTDPDTGTWRQEPEYTWRNTGFPQTDDHPVVNVSWNDAVAFCDWLSRTEGRTYRLPTEAEWEYACRAGTTTRYWHGDDPEGLPAVANVADATAKEKFPGWKWSISARDGYVFTAPVGSFKANPFGLYDMHGNVWEWCADCYQSDYYAKSPRDDPPGPPAGSFRVDRGGCWIVNAMLCRSASRIFNSPDGRGGDLGFRVARTP